MYRSICLNVVFKQIVPLKHFILVKMNVIETASCAAPTVGTAPATFAAALNFFAAAQCLIDEKWPQDATVSDGEEFDFIIVGAGSAGAVVANRLSEVSEWKILLIEAGGDPPLESDIPALLTELMNSEYDWQYHTVSNGRTNQANINDRVSWPRGKMLGGCSAINFMVYLRGNPQDYQRWFDDGNEEWHPDVVQEYFRKAENLQNQELLSSSSKFYGETGPQVINTFNNSYGDLSNNILKSYDDIGIKHVPDLNAAGLGAGVYTDTAANGQRQGTGTTYLNPIRDRKNLKVIKHSFATKLLVNESSKEVFGVEVMRNNTKYNLYASKEVVLSAGSINTPQILLLSGIGPKDHLNEKNITCIHDSPAVGQNLEDHLLVSVPIYGNVSGPTEKEVYYDAIRYLFDRKGYLANSPLANIVSLYSNNTSYATYQNHMHVFWKNSSKLASWMEGWYKPTVSESVVQQNKEQMLFLFFFTLLHPFSKGNITLNSSDPYDPPLINANYFGDERDLEATVDGIKKLTKIVDTDYFKSIGGRVGRMSWPACDDLELDGEDYWKCIAINMVMTTYHPTGTAKMGKDDRATVVNGRLKVHGVGKLRVIDASVMPSLTSANTNAPSIMIGERGSDLIKQDYNII